MWRIRNGMVFTKNTIKLKIIQRNCTRSKGLIIYKDLTSDEIKFSYPQKFKEMVV